MRILLFLLVALAGCASGLDSASLSIDGGDLEIDTDQRFAAHTRPTAPLYEAHGRPHADFYTLHDLLFEWADQTGHELETEFYDGGFGFGFTLCAIDDVPPAVVGNERRGCFERGGFWAISADGQSAEVGMSDLPVEDGNAFHLQWTTF